MDDRDILRGLQHPLGVYLMNRAVMIEQACRLALQINQFQDIESGKLVVQRTFDVRVIKSEYRRLQAEADGFVVNVAAIFQNTNGASGTMSGRDVETVAASLGRSG